MAIAAFVLSLVTLFGTAGAVWWLYTLLHEGFKVTKDVVTQVAPRLIAAENKIAAIEAATAYKPKPAPTEAEKRKPAFRTLTAWRAAAEAETNEVQQ